MYRTNYSVYMSIHTHGFYVYTHMDMISMYIWTTVLHAKKNTLSLYVYAQMDVELYL